ncbi:MAG: Gfo/Idh/MocA family oxidoreductase, partial [Verrucomicrobiota bacterium]
MDRRQFHTKSLLFGAAALSHSGASAQDATLKAAVIGHTGRGNYGHRLDVIFRDLPNVQVVAVADADSASHETAKKATGASQAYADYREMLAKEKPNLVSIAPRWTDQHFAMGKAALEAGAHVYMEKPFTQTLAEADELLKIAKEKNLKIAVAHQMLLDPKIAKLKESIDKGELGDLQEIRLFGKQDARAGAEDMIVLGTHLFDLARYFVGDAVWCSARISEKGSEITAGSGRSANKEDLGKIAGDHINAYFAMSNGVDLTFQSRPNGGITNGPWGMELVGTKAKVRVFAGHPVKTFWVTAAKIQNYTY